MGQRQYDGGQAPRRIEDIDLAVVGKCTDFVCLDVHHCSRRMQLARGKRCVRCGALKQMSLSLGAWWLAERACDCAVTHVLTFRFAIVTTDDLRRSADPRTAGRARGPRNLMDSASFRRRVQVAQLHGIDHVLIVGHSWT